LSDAAMIQFAIGSSFAGTLPDPESKNSKDAHTRTPIKHVIVIIGENRSFDHVFATYIPKNGESVHNLLSQGIINADGSPCPNFKHVKQKAANDTAPDAFELSPPKTEFPGDVLPAPLVGGPADSFVTGDSLTKISKKYYGTPNRWDEIMKANPGIKVQAESIPWGGGATTTPGFTPR